MVCDLCGKIFVDEGSCSRRLSFEVPIVKASNASPELIMEEIGMTLMSNIRTDCKGYKDKKCTSQYLRYSYLIILLCVMCIIV